MCDGEVSESQAQASLRFPSPRVGISLVFFCSGDETRRSERAEDRNCLFKPSCALVTFARSLYITGVQRQSAISSRASLNKSLVQCTHSLNALSHLPCQARALFVVC